VGARSLHGFFAKGREESDFKGPEKRAEQNRREPNDRRRSPRRIV